MTNTKRFFTVAETANHFSITTRTVYNLVHRGQLQAWNPTGRIGGYGLRITAESITALERQGAIASKDYAK